VAAQEAIDRANSEFWNELCGSILARTLGIRDHSPDSLRRFDDAFLGFYPYLLPLVRPEQMHGKKVLEIGLGYGTLGQVLVEMGAEYTGLDIAQNPVQMMNRRLQLQGLPGRAVQGSALDMPLPAESMDFVVSIGCFHHTGNVQRCLDETWRVLRPGGTALIMVYNKFSFRHWLHWPWWTFKEFLRSVGVGKKSAAALHEQIAACDRSASSETAAPETVFLSARDLRTMLQRFEQVQVVKRNSDPIGIRGRTIVPRSLLLPTVGRLCGLDLYARAVKALAQHQALAA
jgi:ubiquinone/menaquinone biosynthesis C-methylase UbiE